MCAQGLVQQCTHESSGPDCHHHPLLADRSPLKRDLLPRGRPSSNSLPTGTYAVGGSSAVDMSNPPPDFRKYFELKNTRCKSVGTRPAIKYCVRATVNDRQRSRLGDEMSSYFNPCVCGPEVFVHVEVAFGAYAVGFVRMRIGCHGTVNHPPIYV